MLVELVGVIGAAVGFGIKWVFDALTERSHRRRADVLWRREQTALAASDFLGACIDLADIVGRISNGETHLQASRQNSQHDENLREASARLEELRREKTALYRKAATAYSRLELFVGADVARAAGDYLVAARNRGPTTGSEAARKHLVDALRPAVGGVGGMYQAESRGR